ncbi:DUF423 domain-containing protein [Zhouia sp. PK063]|uniref:DUF423 domain-containing protein n=1 Tax=Zhouia sp. PK063 TaxID=3373602 RepID=UPI0037AEB978
MIAQLFGAIFGMLAVIFGAFGAHALKKRFTEDQQKSFETGVKYQMYHAIVLLIIGEIFKAPTTVYNSIVVLFVLGTVLFSFSIYGLCLSAASGKKMKFLGPVTPLGGLLLTIGWALLIFHFVAIL